MAGCFSSQQIAKLERIREDLMRRRGELVDDSDLLNHVLERYEEVERDAEKDAELAANCEQKETPDWLRSQVMARDGMRCAACDETERLHVHHIVYRCRGGLTREDNLVSLCRRCHALIHEGRLFAARTAEGLVEFRDRSGALLGPDVSAGLSLSETSLSGAVLRVLREPLDANSDANFDAGLEGGGQPPPSPSLQQASQALALPMDFDHSKVPDAEMTAWLKARWHLFDLGVDGALRVKKSILRAAAAQP